MDRYIAPWRIEVTLCGALCALLVLGVIGAQAQTPQPFPRPGQPPPPAAPPPDQPAPQVPGVTAPVVPPTTGTPTEAELGVPIYPAATFLTSYDAGRGQRYYLYGVLSGFDEMVTYYRSVLDDNGDRLYSQPPTHMFEVGPFDDDEMAFPPSVTIKDYTFGGSAGYPGPAAGEPTRFPTVIQIVPPPPTAPQR